MAASAQAMQIVGDAASIAQLISNISSTFTATKQALKDMTELPPELDELEYITEEGGRKWTSLSKVIPEQLGRSGTEERVRPCLQRLEMNLQAARKIAYEHRTAGNKNSGKEFVSGLLGSGASEQLRAAKRLKASIQNDLGILDGVINEFTLEAVKLLSHPQVLKPVSKSAMVLKLDRLSNLKHADLIVRSVESAPSHSANYQPLRGIAASVEDENLERGSVYGGFEVENSCKLRLTMEAGEPRYFYLVTFDSSDSDPQLFHPQRALQNYQLKLQRNGTACRRVFPSKHLYKNDPEWKLAKDTALRRDEVERCFVYILFSESRVEPDGQLPTIMDVKRKLDAEGCWRNEKEVIVECLLFDVK